MAASDGGSKKAGVLQQILVAVAIAVLAGSTSPWWWNELKPLIAAAIGDGNGSAGTPATPERTVTPERTATPERPATRGDTADSGRAYSALADAAADADRIQAWYLRGRRDGLDCSAYQAIVDEIRKFAGNPRPLPASLADTLRYAGTDPAPTINSLAVDRSRRIVSARRACF